METKTVDISSSLHKKLKTRAKKNNVTLLKTVNEIIKAGLTVV